MVIATQAAWAAGRLVLAAVLAGLSLLAAVVVAQRPVRQWCIPVGAMGIILVAASRIVGWWPCPVACQGGSHYQELLGISVSWWAIVGAGGVMVAWCRPAWRWWAAMLALAMAGGALFFLAIAVMLGLECAYCGAVHSMILVTAVVAAGQVRWWWQVTAAALGAGMMVLGFGWRVVADIPSAPAAAQVVTVGTPPADDAEPWDAVRRWGFRTAPRMVEIAFDVHCPGCGGVVNPLFQQLAPQVDAGRVQVVIRLVARPRSASARELAEHLLATGDPRRMRQLMTLLAGLDDGVGWSAASPRVALLEDPAGIHAAWTAHRIAIAAVVDADQRRLAELGCRRTPFLIVSDVQGKELGRWQGPACVPEAVMAVINGP